MFGHLSTHINTTTMVKLLILALLSNLSFIAKNETCNLPAPASGSGTHNGNSVSISWANVSGAVSYRLRVIDLETDEVIYSEVVSGTSANVPNTNAGHDYRAQIGGTCSEGESTNIIVVDVMGVTP